MRERDIEAYLVKRVKALGGEVRKVKWIGRSKAPDRVVMLPGGWGRLSTVWVELKTPGGLAAFPKNAHEEAQQREHERMRDAGQTVVVLDSKEGIDALFR